MPSTSKKQHNFMAAVASNPKFAKKVGVKSSIGEEFMKADKGRKFRTGGLKEVDSDSNPGLSKLPTDVRNKMGYMKKGGEAKAMVKKEVEFMKKKGAPKSMVKHEMAEAKGMCYGGKVKKMNDGGMTSYSDEMEKPKSKKMFSDAKISRVLKGNPVKETELSDISESGAAKGLRNYGRMYKQGLGMKPDTPYEYKKGGMTKHEDIKLDKKIVKKAVGMHDKQLHGGKKTNLSKLARGGGIEIKGKTKGKMVKMKYGGSC